MTTMRYRGYRIEPISSGGVKGTKSPKGQDGGRAMSANVEAAPAAPPAAEPSGLVIGDAVLALADLYELRRAIQTPGARRAFEAIERAVEEARGCTSDHDCEADPMLRVALAVMSTVLA
jgi:hypothetical protein